MFKFKFKEVVQMKIFIYKFPENFVTRNMNKIGF